MKKKEAKIYLDYAASTPVDPDVLKAMLPYFKEEYGNPSSIHSFGQRALAAIDEAREKVAAFLGCEAGEVIFTGSATEGNNLAIQGVVRSSQLAVCSFAPHIVTSQIEHDSVLEACRALEKEGVEVTYLSATKDGFVRPEDVRSALKENTVLVSIMYANNEIGTIQSIAEIADNIRDFSKSKIQNPKSKIYLHTDAVQAVNYLDCNVENLGVDLLTLSGHKIYGPKGVGALYKRKGIMVKPLIHGGGQERALRSGTENVAGIAGLGEAITQITKHKFQSTNKAQSTKHKTQNEMILRLREKLIDGVLREVPGARLNGSRDNRLPNNANFCFPGADAETLIIALDQEGIAVSSGSACSTRAIRSSHVLLAIGLSAQDVRSSVRVTLGKHTTEQDIKSFLETLPRIVERIRMLS